MSYKTVIIDGEPVFVKAGAPVGNKNAAGVHDMIRQISMSSAAPEHKKVAIDAIMNQHSELFGNKNAAHSNRHATFEDEKKEMESDSVKGIGRNGATFITPQKKGWVGVIETPTHYIDEHLQTGKRRMVEKKLSKASPHSDNADERAKAIEGKHPNRATFADLKSSNNLLATYRQISVQGDEPVFVKCAWSDNARAAALEARRNGSSKAHDATMEAHSVLESKGPGEEASQAHKIASELHAAAGKNYGEGHKRQLGHADMASFHSNMSKAIAKGFKGGGRSLLHDFLSDVKSHSPIQATWSDASRQASAEARRAKATDPEHLAGKISEHDTAMFSAKDPKEYAAHVASRAAYSASDKAAASGKPEDHHAALAAHRRAAKLHSERNGGTAHYREHGDMATEHNHLSADRTKRDPGPSHPNRDWRGGSHED